ncbi:MAG: hypothetical protein Kow0089_01190 [Desulfobulbaceae bacterium]
MKSIALFFLIAGGLLFAAGLILLFADKISWLGQLPGDIHLKFKNFSFHFPLTSCLLISLVLTVLLNIIFRFFGK